MSAPATQQPYHSTYKDNFVEGYETIEEANANVAQRNAQAKELGLSGIYEVKHLPWSA